MASETWQSVRNCVYAPSGISVTWTSHACAMRVCVWALLIINRISGRCELCFGFRFDNQKPVYMEYEGRFFRHFVFHSGSTSYHDDSLFTFQMNIRLHLLGMTAMPVQCPVSALEIASVALCVVWAWGKLGFRPGIYTHIDREGRHRQAHRCAAL